MTANSENQKTIMLVENKASPVQSISEPLKQAGYEVITAPSADRAVQLLNELSSISLVLIDTGSRQNISPALTAEQVLALKQIPILFLIDLNRDLTVENVNDVPHYGFIFKNSGPAVLKSVIENAFKLFKANELIRESEENYREIFDSSNEPLFIHNHKTGVIIDVNQTMLDMFGYNSKDDVIGKKAGNFSAPEEGFTGDIADELIRKTPPSGRKTFEWRAKKKNGENFWAEGILQAIKIRGEKRIIASIRDISYRKHIEETLKKSEERLKEQQKFSQMLIDTSPAFITAIDTDGRIILMNRAFLSAVEYTMDELRGADYLTSVVPEEDRERLALVFKKIISEGQVDINENRIRSKSGSIFLVEWFGQMVKREDDGTDFFVGIGIDITRRKQAEEELMATNEELTAMNEEMEASNEELIAINHELQIAEERYRGVVESQSEMIARFLSDGKITFVNRSYKKYYEKHLGFTDDPTGKMIPELMQLKNFPQVQSYLQTLKPGELSASMERSFVSVNGETRWQLWYIQKIIDPDSGLIEFQVVGNDITEQKKTELSLRESEEKFKLLIDMAPDAILIGSSEGIIMRANHKATELTGYSHEEMKGKSINMFFTDEELKKVPLRYDLLKQGKVVQNERILTRKDGSTAFIEMNTRMMPDGKYQAFIRDTTEKHKFLEAVRQTDKLNSLGVLAGGIAHDFNNLLSGIFGYIEMARLKSASDKKVSDYLDKAFTVFNRARDLTQQLLTFSKGGTPVKKTGDIRLLLKESTAFALSGSNLICNYNFDEGLWLCDYDANQLAQVIDNMIINAKQAMPSGGNIIVRADNCVINENEHPVLNDGNYIHISITDTGIGIPQEMLKQIFDPFFTTKQQGSGLGLATSYSIIQKHGGIIEADSIPGKGSTFHIFLPASNSVSTAGEHHSFIHHKGSGTILIMDDEDFIREIAGDILSDMGYSVIYARDGEDAIRLCIDHEQNGGPVDAAIFDLTIPGGMGGKEALIEIRKRYPDMPVFASSGFSEDPIMSHPAEYGFTASIRKPYRRDEMAELLNNHLADNL